MNLQDQFIRRAIWEIYNSRCFYTGNPLEYSDMELDHIIPASYKDRPNQLHKILEECGLDENFQLNSLYNLVPTNKLNNGRKGDTEFDTKALLLWLGLIKKNVPAIEQRIIKLKKKRNYDEHLSMLKTHVDDEKEDKKKEKLLTEIIGFISDESADFIEREGIYDKDNEQFFRKYKKSIGLEAIVPKYNNPETECALYFKTLKARDCIVILDNKTILSQLFRGLFTDPKYGARGFQEFDQSQYNNLETINLENTNIRLGNNRLKLSKDDIYALCDVVDSYALKYIEIINNIEGVLKTHSFPLSKRKNNYKLISVSYSDWRKLIDFTFRYDVDAGKSKWNIFDKNYHYIKIYTNRDREKYDSGYHAFFQGEYSEDIVMHPELVSKDIYITFEFIEDFDSSGYDSINERRNWDAEIAYFWLVNELLPKVLGKRSTNKILNKSKDHLNNFLENNIFERIQYINKKKINNHKDLYESVLLIQKHFYENPHDKYRINKQNFIGVYNSIVRCLVKSKNADLHYICNKLHLAQCESPAELIDFINGLIESIEDTTINGFGIDYLFRALLIALQSKKIILTKEDLEYIRNEISFFIEVHDREVLFKKYALTFQIG